MSERPSPVRQTPEPLHEAPAGRPSTLRRGLATLGRILVFLLSLGMLCPHVFSPDDEE